MGALATAWQVRNPAQIQVNLTNQGVEGATTVNTAVLAAAETDASNQFFHLTGIAFDTTNSEHLTLGCLGVTYFLYTYQGNPKSAVADAAKTSWKDACGSFARTRGSIAAQLPLTNSNLLPTADESGQLPYFDRRVMSDLVPRAPGSGLDDASALDFSRGAGA